MASQSENCCIGLKSALRYVLWAFFFLTRFDFMLAAYRTDDGIAPGRRKLGMVETAVLRIGGARLNLAREAMHWFVEAILGLEIALAEAAGRMSRSAAGNEDDDDGA